MDLIDQIGPVLGLAAFVGLAVLAFLIFQQSRDVRRLREWAGRAPERAQEAADASLAAAEARGEGEERPPGRIATARAQLAERLRPRLHSLDRRLPIDGRILLGVVLAGVVAAGALTSGFGLGGGGDESGARKERRAEAREERPKVAVFNATQQNGVAGVPGLATKVATQVLKPAGYPLGAQTNAPAGFPETVVMFAEGEEGPAATLARAIQDDLGETSTEPMSDDIRELAGDAKLALVVGIDDDGF